MPYNDGWSAMNLDMPPRIPRTEYSAHEHWDLVNTVTGSSITPDSFAPDKQHASSAFVKAWNYDCFWSTLIHNQPFGDLRTRMGHAEYATQGSDFIDDRNCPFNTPEDVLNFDPSDAYGAIDQNKLARDFENHYRQNQKKYPDLVNMTGIYITCISGLLEIFGWDMMLLALGTDPVRFGDLANRYARWIQHYFNALAQADVPVVMVHDDIAWTTGPFTRPDWYRQYVFPHYKKFFTPLIDSGKKVLFTSDGNYTEFIDDIAAAGANGFVMEPTTDMQYVADTFGQSHIIIGNADTRILLNGSKQQIRDEVARCIAIGKRCPGFFFATGNHIPSNTPAESAIFYNKSYQSLAKR